MPIVGKAGRYMSIDIGANAVRAPSRMMSSVCRLVFNAPELYVKPSEHLVGVCTVPKNATARRTCREAVLCQVDERRNPLEHGFLVDRFE